jgi:hypothetical protein
MLCPQRLVGSRHSINGFEFVDELEGPTSGSLLQGHPRNELSLTQPPASQALPCLTWLHRPLAQSRRAGVFG